MHKRWLLLLFLGIIYFPIFFHLDSQPIRNWDEGLFAIRAYYMAETGDYLSDFSLVEGMPEHRNTKPPFVTWLQVLSMKTLGYNALALRLPIALLVLFLALFLVWFFQTEFKKPLMGMVAALVLLTSTGFVRGHVSRTGDQDAALAVFMFVSVAFFYRYARSGNDRERIRNLAFLTLSLFAATLTKHVVGLLFVPGMILYLALTKKLVWALKDKWVYFFLFLFLLALVALYGYYEWRYPGFLARIWKADLAGRYVNTIDMHKHTTLYYFNGWTKGNFLPWIYWLPLSFLLLFTPGYEKYKPLLLLLWACVIPYFTVISFSETKTFWYDAPLYPLLAALAGAGIFFVYRYLKEDLLRNMPFSKLTLGIYFFGLVFLMPYSKTIQRISHPEEISPYERYAYLMKKLERDHPEIRAYTILTDNTFSMQPVFKKLAYNKKGYDIKLQKYQYSLSENDLVLICLEGPLKVVEESFEYTTIEESHGCRLIRVGAKKEGGAGQKE